MWKISTALRAFASPAFLENRLKIGDRITFVGTIAADPSTGERYVSVGSVTSRTTGYSPLAPIGITNSSIVSTGITTGLFVKTWGKVVQEGAGYFIIGDGSASDLKVTLISDSPPPVGAFITVTGISSFNNDDGVISPVINAVACWRIPRSIFRLFKGITGGTMVKDFILIQQTHGPR